MTAHLPSKPRWGARPPPPEAVLEQQAAAPSGVPVATSAPAPRCVSPGCGGVATRGIHGPALCDACGEVRGVPFAPEAKARQRAAGARGIEGASGVRKDTPPSSTSGGRGSTAEKRVDAVGLAADEDERDRQWDAEHVTGRRAP